MADKRHSMLWTPGFVGRLTELGQLTRLMARRPALVLVEGEAGIGKTRLVTEWLAAAARDRRRVVVTCPPFRQPYTLGPIVDAVRQATSSPRGLGLSDLAGALRPLFPEWSADLPPDLPPVDDVTAARYRLFHAWHELLTRLDVDLLVVEDAHWADESTLDFLLFLASRQPPPVSLLVTYRPEDLDTDSSLRRLAARTLGSPTPHRLTLRPLDIAQTREFVSSMLAGERVSDRFAAFLHQHSGGIPFAMEEMLRLLHERADVTRTDEGWVRRFLEDIVVPPTIRDAVHERIARLSEPAQAVVRASAVLADPTPRAGVAEVSGEPARSFAAGLAEAEAAWLLTVDAHGLVSCRHSLACQAIYQTIAEPDQREMHRRAGLFLERQRPAPVARLAHHFRRADDLDRWADYTEKAADIAARSGDEATAARLLCDVLATMRLPPRRMAELAAKVPHGPVFGTGRQAELITVLRHALAHTDHVPTEAELRFVLGRILLTHEHRAGQDELARAVEHLDHAPEKAAMAMALLGDPWNIEWSIADHVAWVDRAGVVAATLPDDQRLPITVRRMTSLIHLGEESGWELADQLPEAPHHASAQDSMVRGHVNLADAAILWGRYDAARRHFARVHALIDAEQYPHVVDLVRATEAHLDWFTGNWDVAADTLRLVDDGVGTTGLWPMEVALVSARLHVAVGEDEVAERELTSLIDSRDTTWSSLFLLIAEATTVLATLRTARGDFVDALRVTDEATRLGLRMSTWLWATELVPARLTALVGLGRLTEAAELVAAFDAGLGDRAAPAPRAGLLLCHAILADARGEVDLALASYDRAVAAWQAMPRPYDALLTRARAAGCLAGAGRTEEAVGVLRAVHQGLTGLGASADARRVETVVRGLGASVRPAARRGRRGYGDALSPRELEVVRHLVLGRSNREIAEALSRSPKTVAAQLESARRKLNVTSRTAVAVAAIEAGLVQAPTD